MDDAEIKRSVVTRIVHPQVSRIRHPKPGRPPLEAFLRPSYHLWVQVNRIDSSRAKPIQYDLHTDSSTAPDFERAAPSHHAAHSFQARPLKVPLNEGAHGIVHQQKFKLVQSHKPGSIINRAISNYSVV